MKININTKPRGSVLLASLITVTIILTSLASYLLLVSNESQAVTRSQGWNTCIPVMEAGVEEALTQIHYTGITGLSSNNWTLGSDGAYHKTRYVGANGSYCQVSIQGTNPPTIYSEAYVSAASSFQNTSYGSNYVVREVRVTTQSAGSWGGGLTAKGSIAFHGNALFDSYNSANGPYNPLIHGTNAVALSDTNVADAISLNGNDKLYGMAVTGPGGSVNTAVTTTGHATVGDAAWNAAGGNTSLSPNTEPGWTANDANFQFNDVSAPYESGTPPTTGTLAGTNYTYLLNGDLSSSYYLAGDLSVNGGTMMVKGNITLYVTGNVSFNGTLTIAPGSSLTFYVGGSFSMSGNGIVNSTGIPANCNIQCLPTCTSVSYAGNADFYGTVNAPEASMSFSGNADAYGAFIGHDITLNGNGNVHFDEALRNAGGYVVASWNEIRPQ